MEILLPKLGSISSCIHQKVGNWIRKQLTVLDLRFENFCNTLFALENGAIFFASPHVYTPKTSGFGFKINTSIFYSLLAS